MFAYHYNKGTALFITGVIISIALAVGIGVSTISFRELRITRIILPSFQAFYAADAGVECAYYWGNPDPFLGRFKYNETSDFTIPCLEDSDDVTVNYTTSGNGLLTRVYTFERMFLDNGFCVDVTVRARNNVTHPDPLVTTPIYQCLRIDSFGRSDCGAGGGVKVERGLLWKDPVECPDEF